jgi:hypothetical protein
VVQFLKHRRQAGGVDVQEDVAAVLSGISPSTVRSSRDVATAAYAYWWLAEESGDRRVKAFAEGMATEYASRFADWLGHVFLVRANLTRTSKAMRELEEGIEAWTEFIPAMLETNRPVDLEDYVPAEVSKYIDMSVMNKIGGSIFRKVQQEYSKAGTRQASDLDDLPVDFNPRTRRYEIPKRNLRMPDKAKLEDVGFDFDGVVWHIDHLDSEVLKELPQLAKLERGAKKPLPLKPPREWFFEDYLPRNLDRFTKIFNEYGRVKNVPYEFQFMLAGGKEVNVKFTRNIKTIAEAIAELQARYGKGGDREGWMQAIDSYLDLKKSRGGSAFQAVDRANDLQHSHGSMIEHFPDGVSKWYPAFLDFKYSADPVHLIQALRDQDLREIAMELLPVRYRKERLSRPRTEHRTVRGLAMEVASQKGKAAKKKRLRGIKDMYPEVYLEVVKELEGRGLSLTAHGYGR